MPELASRQHIRDICGVVERALDDGGVTLDAISAPSRSPRGRVSSARCWSASSFAKAAAAAARSAARRRPPSRRAHRIAGAAERRAAAAGRRARRVGRPHEPVSRRASRATTSFSAGRATMRRARRTTRSPSCSASAIRADRSIDRLAQTGNDRAVALPTTRLTHADRNAPGAEGRSRFQLQRPEDRGAAPRARQRRGQPLVGRRGRRHLRDAFSASSSPRSSSARSTRRGGIRRRSIGVAGGVSANSRLRADLKAHGDAREMPTFVPSLQLSTDNAAMIAAAGLRKFRAGITVASSTSTPTRRSRCDA